MDYANNLPMSFIIRNTVESDLKEILAIYNHAVLHTTASYDYEERSYASQLEWFAAHDARHPVFTALQNDMIAGWASLNAFNPKPGYQFTGEISVYIAPQFQGQGLGSLLLQKLIDSARKLSYRSMIAIISNDNRISLKLHEKYGFKQVGLFREVGYKMNQWLDVAYLQLFL